jgi:hypothetical protein
MGIRNKALFMRPIPAYTHGFTRPDTLGGSRINFGEITWQKRSLIL